jgi:Tfp pilus assembly protein PilF
VVARTEIAPVLTFVAVALASLPWSGGASAQSVQVIGGGLAHECYVLVRGGGQSRLVRDLCTRALETEALSQKDRAATYVNRGIVALRNRDPAPALSDFDAALSAEPSLGAAFLNRSGAYLLTGQWFKAQIDADTAIAMGAGKDTWAAHFNRGVALERLGDVAGAWRSFTTAQTLAPNQPEPKAELARFEVKAG